MRLASPGATSSNNKMPLELKGVTPLISVFDMPTALRFYRDLLGFEIVTTSKLRNPDDCDFAWLRLGDADVMLNTLYDPDVERPAVLPPARADAHQDTALFFACPDVDAAYEHLRSKELDVEKPHVAHYGMKQLYLRDPDGYTLCFQWPSNPDPQS